VTLGIYDTANGFRPDNSSDANAVRVRGERSPDRGNGVNRLFSALFVDDAKKISVKAIAARPVNVFYQPPESRTLDPEAGDYNEIYVYCFDTRGSGSADSRRSQMTLVSNNMPPASDIVATSGGLITANPPTNPTWPRCTQEGQTLSIRLRNIRHVKANPVLWGNPAATVSGVQPGRPEHNYYTDTRMKVGSSSSICRASTSLKPCGVTRLPSARRAPAVRPSRPAATARPLAAATPSHAGRASSCISVSRIARPARPAPTATGCGRRGPIPIMTISASSCAAPTAAGWAMLSCDW
jgi:hypothetical protein